MTFRRLNGTRGGVIGRKCRQRVIPRELANGKGYPAGRWIGCGLRRCRAVGGDTLALTFPRRVACEIIGRVASITRPRVSWRSNTRRAGVSEGAVRQIER